MANFVKYLNWGKETRNCDQIEEKIRGFKDDLLFKSVLFLQMTPIHITIHKKRYPWDTHQNHLSIKYMKFINFPCSFRSLSEKQKH